jgi:HEAT repeat protein
MRLLQSRPVYLKSALKSIIRALGALKNDEAIEPLLAHFQALQTPPAPHEQDFEWQASIQTFLSAFQFFKDDRVVSTLMRFAGQVTPPRIKCLTLDALARIGNVSITPLLIACLNHEDYRVQQAAIRGLAQVGASDAVEPLIALLEAAKTEPSTAVCILQALSRLHDKRAWPALVQIISLDTTPEICSAAASALLALDASQAEPLLMSLLNGHHASQPFGILDAFSHLTQPEIVQTLSIWLPKVPPKLRLQIIRNWAASEIADTVPALLARLPDESEDTEVRQEAANALGNLKAQAAVPYLLALIDHPNPALVARIMDALGKIGDPRAVPKLIEKLDDDRPAYYLSDTVYDWADRALRAIGTPDCIEAVNQAFRTRNQLDMHE